MGQPRGPSGAFIRYARYLADLQAMPQGGVCSLALWHGLQVCQVPGIPYEGSRWPPGLAHSSRASPQPRICSCQCLPMLYTLSKTPTQFPDYIAGRTRDG